VNPAVVKVTQLERLARSTRDLLNTLAAITGRKAGFHSLADMQAAELRVPGEVARESGMISLANSPTVPR
jgi:DNA invertase Pin-like site-specific DNA recombinase